jgi:hypothetical protein
MSHSPQSLAQILLKAMQDSENRLHLVKIFQEIVWDADEPLGSEEVERILNDLAYDLDYYEPNPEWRREVPSFYGDERFEEEVRSALVKLAEEGVHPKKEQSE